MKNVIKKFVLAYDRLEINWYTTVKIEEHCYIDF